MKTMKFESKITDIEYINPLFSKIKIRIAYTGVNPNGSHFSKESFEKAIPSIYNCPVIGEYFEETDCFGSHGGRIIIDDKGVRFEQTTMPYGCIDANSEISWETVEEDGIEKEYLCATGYLWTSRYPEVEQVVNNSAKQSMEIEIESGKTIEIDGKKYFDITDFLFSGFCILGSAEPCFASSEITSYTNNCDEFKNQFYEMVKELKNSLQTSDTDDNINSKGGQNVDLQALLAKYSITQEELLEHEINVEDYSLEDLEAKIQEIQKKPENKDDFSLTVQDVISQFRTELNKDAPMDEWGWQIRNFYYVDHNETVLWAESREDNWKIAQFDYSISNDNVTIDMTSKKMCKIVKTYVPVDDADDASSLYSERFEYDMNVKEKELEKKFNEEKDGIINDFTSKLDTANQEFTALETEHKKLNAEYQTKLEKERKDAENELFEKFSEKLSEDELAPIRETASDYSLEDLEKELFVMVGRKNITFSIKSKEDKSIKVVFDKTPEVDVNAPSWAHIMEE